MKVNDTRKLILFQGDEITAEKYPGIETGSGYVSCIRDKLAQYKILNMAEEDIDSFVMYSRWDERGMDFMPDVFSVLIGKNDITDAEKLPQGETARRCMVLLKTAISEAKRINPDIKLIFIEPFMVVNEDESNSVMFMKAEMTLVQSGLKKLATEHKCRFVETQNFFDKNKELVFENFYPSAAGCKFIADEWIKVFEALR